MADLLLKNSSPEIQKELLSLVGQDGSDVDLDLDKVATFLREHETNRKLGAFGSDESIAYISDRLGIPDANNIQAEQLLIQLVNAQALAKGNPSRAVAASRTAFSNDMHQVEENARKFALRMNDQEERARLLNARF